MRKSRKLISTKIVSYLCGPTLLPIIVYMLSENVTGYGRLIGLVPSYFPLQSFFI